MVSSAQAESVNPPSTTSQSNGSWSNVGSTNQQSSSSAQSSNQQTGQKQQQSSTYRVARIFENSVDVPQGGDGEPVIFDLRSQSAHESDSSVRVIHFFIGDEPDDSPKITGVRDMVTEARFAETRVESDAAVTKFHDAQGRSIPVLGMRDIEVHVMDQGGQMIVIKERVAISDQIQQPILCFGFFLKPTGVFAAVNRFSCILKLVSRCQ